MAQPLEYKEAMGTKEGHQAVYEQRIRAAEQALAEADAKPAGIKETATKNAENALVAIREEYEKFKKDNGL
jgi:hypothetical protein